jgi:hypothetical protein
MKPTVVLVLLAIVGAGVGLALAQNQPGSEIPANVLDVFKRDCQGCHSGLLAPRGLKLIPSKLPSVIGARSKEMPALKILNADDPASSYMLMKIEGASNIKGKKMPANRVFTDADLQTLKAWILGLKAK